MYINIKIYYIFSPIPFSNNTFYNEYRLYKSDYYMPYHNEQFIAKIRFYSLHCSLQLVNN